MTPILILVAFLALAAGYFAGRFTARARPPKLHAAKPKN